MKAFLVLAMFTALSSSALAQLQVRCDYKSLKPLVIQSLTEIGRNWAGTLPSAISGAVSVEVVKVEDHADIPQNSSQEAHFRNTLSVKMEFPTTHGNIIRMLDTNSDTIKFHVVLMNAYDYEGDEKSYNICMVHRISNNKGDINFQNVKTGRLSGLSVSRYMQDSPGIISFPSPVSHPFL